MGDSCILILSDYCNFLYHGINCTTLARFQIVQNAAARLLKGLRKSCTIPQELLDLEQKNLLVVPRYRLQQRGIHAFAVEGPKLWNSLLIQIRSAPSLPLSLLNPISSLWLLMIISC